LIMRFIQNGPNIPDDLLLARDEGRVLFFCGAGVSRARANLADFFELTSLVLDRLRVPSEHTTRKVLDEAKEIGLRTGASGLISADRIFGLLEREFSNQDVEEAVAKALRAAENVDLSAHRIMLDLAKSPEGKVRLVTTNFDRLFEACDAAPNIWYPSRLPDPTRKAEFHGVIHLHGVVNQNYDRAEGDSLILSSSEFGRAYLAEGWATQFIREILNQYIVVFVGYGADDPPIQYLLEALNKSRVQLNNVYAFQEGTQQDAISKWQYRGVEAIAYNDKNKHAALWDSLAAWAKRAQSPESWYQTVIDLAKQGPEPLEPFERGQVAHVVSSLEGAQKFSDGAEVPPAEWLCVFDPARRYELPGKDWWYDNLEDSFDPFTLYGLDCDVVPQPIDSNNHNAKREIPAITWNAFAANKQDRQNLQDWNFSALYGYRANTQARLAPRLHQLGVWLTKVSDQPAAVWWAAKQSALHPEIQSQIRKEVIHGAKVVDHAIRKAWGYLFESWSHQDSYQQHSFDAHHLKTAINKDGWSSQYLREYAFLNRPYLKVKHNFWCKRRPPKLDENLSYTSMLNLEIEYPERIDIIQIHDDWLEACIQEWRKNLEHAVQLENEINQHSFISIGSIHSEGDPAIDRHSRTVGLYGYVIHFSELFERLLKLDVVAARREFSLWPINNQDVFDRLRIWASGMPELVTDQDFSSTLLELNDEIFWDSYSRRDLLMVLARRWCQLPIGSRTSLEKKLLAGRTSWVTESEEEFLERNAWLTLNNLHWLASQGCCFTFDLSAETERLRQHAPSWTEKQIKTAAESMGSRGGFVSYNEDYTPLLCQPLSTILSKSQELSGRSEDFLIENAPFAGLCAAKPVRAFSALTHAAKNDEFPKWAWERFLYSPARDKDKPRFSAFVVARIASYSPEKLFEIIYPVTQWIKKIAKTLAIDFYPIYSRIINHLITTIECRPAAIGSSIVRGNKPTDWISETINSSVGHVVEILMSDPELDGLKENTGLPIVWVSLVDRLLALPDDLHRYALVLLVRNLQWFNYVDPIWTENNLLEMFSSENSEDQQAAWCGFLWTSQTPSQPLYMRLKPQMLNLAKTGELFRQELEKPLVGIILAGWGSIHEKSGEKCVSDDEFHDLVLHLNDESRRHIIWLLQEWSSGNDDWARKLPMLFKGVWPKQQIAKTTNVSLALFDLIFSSLERFEQLAELVLPLLAPIKKSYIDVEEIGTILDTHPELSLEIFYKVFAEVGPIDLPYDFNQALNRIASANEQLRAEPKWLKLKRKSNER
jgi:hypothetical protein